MGGGGGIPGNMQWVFWIVAIVFLAVTSLAYAAKVSVVTWLPQDTIYIYIATNRMLGIGSWGFFFFCVVWLEGGYILTSWAARTDRTKSISTNGTHVVLSATVCVC